jgi:hypothetical protein
MLLTLTLLLALASSAHALAAYNASVEFDVLVIGGQVTNVVSSFPPTIDVATPSPGAFTFLFRSADDGAPTLGVVATTSGLTDLPPPFEARTEASLLLTFDI